MDPFGPKRISLAALLALSFMVALPLPMMAADSVPVTGSGRVAPSTSGTNSASVTSGSGAASVLNGAGTSSQSTTPASSSTSASTTATTAEATRSATTISIPTGYGVLPRQANLPNGLKVVLLEDHSFPVVSCHVWYRVGARNEVPGTTGLSHIAEHLMFQNVGTYRKGEMGAVIVRNGGQFNGFTSDDFVAFYETLHPSKLELALKMEAARMRSATFLESDLEEEVARVKKELENEAKDPAVLLNKEVRATAFQRHPYRNPTSGVRVDIENLTVDDVRGFYDRYFHPDNAILVIAGDFKAQAAMPIVSKYFGPLAKSPRPIPLVRVIEPAQKAERRVLMRYPGKREVAQIAYHAPSFSDADAPAMVVLEKLLNAPLNGRLKTKLLDGKVCLSARSAFELKKDPGLFVVNLTAASGTPLQKAVESWDALVNQLKAQLVTDSELRRARNLAEFSLLSERDGPYRAAFNLGYCETLHGWQNAYHLPDKMRGVTAVDLQRVIRKYLTPESRVVGLLSSPNATPPAPPKQAPGATPPGKQTPPPKNPPSAGRAQKRHTATDISQRFPLYAYKDDDSSLPRLAQAPAADPPTERPAIVKPNTRVMPMNGALPMPPPTPKPAPSFVPAASEAAATPSPESGKTERAVPVRTERTAPQTAVTGTASGPAATTAPTTAATPATGSASSGATIAASPINKAIKRVLKNGITLVVYESHLAPVVQVDGVISAGDVFDPPTKKGVSHLAALCLDNGTSRVTRVQRQAQEEDLGLPLEAMLKFEPGKENIRFHTRCLSRDLAVQLGQLGAIMKEPATEEDDIEKCKQEFMSALKHSEDSLSNKVERAMLRSAVAPSSVFYPADPMERGKSVSSLKQADLRDFISQNIGPEAITIVVAGDTDADTAARITERAFEGWNRTVKVKTAPAVEVNPRRVLKSSLPLKDRTKSFVCLGRLLRTSRADQDYAQLVIADCALTKHPIFARLIQRIGSEPGLSNSLSDEDIQSRLIPLSKCISWSLNLPVEPNVVPQAVSSIQGELRKFVRNGVSAEELTEVKRYLLNALLVHDMANTTEAAKSTLEGVVQGAPVDFVNTLLTDIRSTNVDSINRFIRTEFEPDLASVIVAGPRQTIREVHGSGAREHQTAPAQQ